jgi:hypothetical protein
MVKMVSGGKHEGSKHNLNFQSATWQHFKHFQNIYIFLIAFFSQHLNYFVIIIWREFIITPTIKKTQ